MNKHHVITAVATLLISVQSLTAQHQHGGGAPAGAGASSTNINPGTSTFQRAFALQATEAQSLQVRSWIQSTAALRMQLDHLSETAQSGESRDLLNDIEALKEVLEHKEMAGSKVLVGLSQPQRSELKKEVKRVEEANRALLGAFADLGLTSGDAPDRKRIFGSVQKALKAMTIERQEQQKLAEEMGVNL